MSARRVLLVHNRYLQPGGEDVAVEAEAALLEAKGHEVHRYETSNETLPRGMRAAAVTMWNRGARSALIDLTERVRPDVVHFHNTFPLLSPSVYYGARGRVRPTIVQTLHNYRLVCPAATLMRSGAPCEKCVGGFAWAGVLHGCYRESRAASLATATMVQAHHAMGTWLNKVDAYIALTPFTREIFVRGGLPAAKLHVKPNFVAPDPGVGGPRGPHFLFVGRLEEGKGIMVLIDAWRAVSAPPPLRIIGSGPLEGEVAALAAQVPGVELLGRVSRERVLHELKSARALIMPVLWYENFPLSVCEAMATGCPVLASDSGNLREILAGGSAGILFRSGDPAALMNAVQKTDDAELRRVGEAGRKLYDTYYTADANYRTLMSIYDAAMTTRAMSA